MKGKKQKKEKKNKKYKFLTNFLIKTGILAAIVIVTLTVFLAVYRMEGNTMSPFVRDGDLCIFYRLENIYLNDVVLYEDEQGNLHVGRVVAGNGQKVDFPENGGYEVNGYLPSEEVPYKTYKAENSNVSYPLQLSGDEYFILNDFRQLTTDSREIGAVSRKQIKGKLLFLMRRRNF